MTSVWAMSLLAQLSQAMDTLRWDEVPSESKEKVNATVQGYIITTPLLSHQDTETPTFAYQDNSERVNLFETPACRN